MVKATGFDADCGLCRLMWLDLPTRPAPMTITPSRLRNLYCGGNHVKGKAQI
jgi:hypothetical protein